MYPRRRKVYRRKRRAFRRRRYRKRIPRSLGPTRIYNWKQTVDLADIQTSAGVSPALFTNQFTLSSLPSFTEFQALFDQFRIKRIKIMYLPPNSIAWTGSTSSQPIGEFYTVLDFDDATTPGSLNDLLQYQTLKRTYFNKPHYGKILKVWATHCPAHALAPLPPFRSLARIIVSIIFCVIG